MADDINALKFKLKTLEQKHADLKAGVKTANYLENDGNQRQEETIIRTEAGIRELKKAIAAQEKPAVTTK